MNLFALITGASKGIGLELANIFASKGYNLVLVARSEKELLDLQTQLQDKYGVTAYIMVRDLSIPDAAQAVFEEIKAKNIEIEFLINNAGFGYYDYFLNEEWDRNYRMMQLNMIALTQFCHLFAKEWKGRKRGKMMNVASTAAFQPGPKMAVYFATKSYVLSLSQALNQEFRKLGITVTALCPGPTDTNFMDDSDLGSVKMLKKIKMPSARQVAQYGFDAMMKGKPVAIHGTANRLVANLVGCLPRKWVVKISEKMIS